MTCQRARFYGRDAIRQYTLVRDRCNDYRRDYAAQWVIGLREMLRICLFLSDTRNPMERQETFELTRLLVREAAEHGYGECRPPLGLMDDGMATFSSTDGALRRLHERIKDALDPNCIMAPGKSGIWGRRFAKAGSRWRSPPRRSTGPGAPRRSMRSSCSWAASSTGRDGRWTAAGWAWTAAGWAVDGGALAAIANGG